MDDFENTITYITEKLFNKDSIIVKKNQLQFSLFDNNIKNFLLSQRRYKRESPEIKDIIKGYKLH